MKKNTLETPPTEMTRTKVRFKSSVKIATKQVVCNMKFAKTATPAYKAKALTAGISVIAKQRKKLRIFLEISEKPPRKKVIDSQREVRAIEDPACANASDTLCSTSSDGSIFRTIRKKFPAKN